MSMKKNLLLLLFFTFSLQAQITKNYKETPLQQVLNELSESYDLIFSFSNETVKNKMITFTINNTPLDEVLLTLKKLTHLNFKKISDRQVIVSRPNTKVEVCGYIFDETTNAPLSFASVLIESSKTGTVVNDAGFFQLGELDESESILIQFVGYKDKTIPVTSFKTSSLPVRQSGCPRISLFVESTALEEVLIVEYLTTGIDKNIDGSLKITNEVLGILPGQIESDIFQGIQLIPGINSPDETATGIQIRGGSPDQNLILWDDIKMYNTGHFFGMLSAFNPNIVSEARIFKGGADPKYGDRVSGVIDIASDQKVPEKFNGGMGANGTHGDVFLKAPFGKKVGLVFSGRRSYTDFFETPTYDAFSEKVFQNTKIVANPVPDGDTEDGEVIEEDVKENNFFFYDTTIKLIADISENDKILISGIYTNNDLDFEINSGRNLLRDKLNIQNKGACFSWTGNKGTRFHHSLKAYYSNYDSDYQYTERNQMLEGEQSVRKNTVEDIGTDLNISYDINTKNSLMLGYQFSINKVFYTITRQGRFENPINESDRVENEANSIYANYKFLPENNGFLNLGLRASHYTVVDKFYVEPRINIEYPFVKFLRIKATAELRYQPISQLVEFEDTQLRLENNLWIHSNNEDVPVIESTQFSGGFLFTKKGWNFEIDGYYKNIDGLTSLTNGFNSAIDSELSVGESAIFGVDVFLKKKFKNFRTWLGYTFNDIEYTFAEIQNTPFPGNNDITHNFRFSNTYKIKNWEFSLGWLWQTGKPFTVIDNSSIIELPPEDSDNFVINYENPNNSRLENYHRLDVSAIYRFNFNKNRGWNGLLGVSLQNVYNRQVPIALSYRIEDRQLEDLELNVLRQQSLRITPNVVFRMYF